MEKHKTGHYMDKDLKNIKMNLTRKSILAAAGGIALASGLVIIFVLASTPFISSFSQELQKKILFLVFGITILVAAPLISLRLNRLIDIKKILGWTFVGMGAEFIIFPAVLLFLVLRASSEGALIFGGTMLIFSIIFGLSSGLISLFLGITLIKRRNNVRR